MRTPGLPGWDLLSLVPVLLLLLAAQPQVAAQISPRIPLPETGLGARQTQTGTLAKVERVRHTQITEPQPPSQVMRQGSGMSRNVPVSAPEGTILLVLNFENHPRDCPWLDRARLLVKDEKGNRYEYAAWRVEQAEYTYCGLERAAWRPVHGPWLNTMWDPIGVRGRMGALVLIYAVPPEAKKLTFTDGLVTIDLKPLMKREPQEGP